MSKSASVKRNTSLKLEKLGIKLSSCPAVSTARSGELKGKTEKHEARPLNFAKEIFLNFVVFI